MTGSRAYEAFAKPVLHLVIAEDEEIWSERLKALEEPLREWSLSKTGQFIVEVHTCRSVEAFKSLVSSHLTAKELVYATLDLGMPLLEGDDRFSEQAGQEMVFWCLEQKRKGECLEFCLVSARESFVDMLYRQSPELERQRVKRIYKSELGSWPAAEAQMLHMVDDIQGFVRRHMSFCTFKLPGSNERVPIWFGSEEPLVGLLSRANRIASSKEAGIYILLSDAGGYEIDWVRLCCELRGLQLKDLDIRVTTPELQPEWRDPFDHPPEALLVRNLDFARNQGCDIAPLLKEKFFEEVERRNSLVFFQFPRFQTQLDVLNRLDEDIELPILNACLAHIDVQQGIGFSFESHRRIITFPPYENLQSLGVIHKTIQFQVSEASRQLDCQGVEIDPELKEVLAEIPWDRMGGLQKLRGLIRSACKSFVAGKCSDEFLTKESFKGDRIVSEEFDGELGFVVRGRRLYDLLENRRTSPRMERWGVPSDPEQALENLEMLWELYDGLDRLNLLSERVREKLGRLPSEPDFAEEEFKALHDAWSFLDKLFESPVGLRKRIERFRSHKADRSWRSYYPLLETKSSKAAVENIRFSWPFTRLPLHPAVAAYLLTNRVRALIHREINEYLERYPDLAVDWEQVEKTRDQLFEAIMQREEEREAAELYARERHSQPVLVHLVPQMNQEEPRSPFAKILASFLTFNSFVALAEHYYVFDSTVIGNKEVLRKVLSERVELGPMVGLLCEYTHKLRSSGRIEKSVFRRWQIDWATAGQQQDAIRLTRQITKAILDSKYRDSVSQEDRSLFHELSDPEGMGQPYKLGSLLRLFLLIRNGFYKNAGGDFESEYGKKLRDLIRRLIVSTTEACRIGRVTEEGTAIDLWSKEHIDYSERISLAVTGKRWRGRLVLAKELASGTGEIEGYEVLFPIDELIRVRRDRGSVWAYYKNKSVWTNLTHVEGSVEEPSLSVQSVEGRKWFPSEDELKAFELWRSLHNG